MIDGVQILNTIPAQTETLNPLLVGLISAILSGAITLLVIALTENIELVDIIRSMILSLIVGFVFIALDIISDGLIVTKNIPESYKVLVSDDVSFNDFINNYNIIEINGNIITVTIKE